jgi:phosphatidylinositol phospholipase C, delta
MVVSDRFKVEDESRMVWDGLIAWSCIRLDRLRPGYRYIKLLDVKGNPIPRGKLLVKIEKTFR